MTTDDALLLAKTRLMVREGRAQGVRQAAGLSQGEIGQVVGVTAAAVSRWERGNRLPRSEAGLRYARLLDSLAKMGAGAAP
jgi:transcriptional regulator with XRE-family HTH domain